MTFGSKRTRNGWGGFSKATKRALEKLHHYGHLRIAGRKNGIRLYQRAPGTTCDQSPKKRFQALALLIARFHSPVDERTLNRALNCLKHIVPNLPGRKALLDEVLESNGFRRETIDGIEYTWIDTKIGSAEPIDQIRFLAPFDPLARDRDRFEHL